MPVCACVGGCVYVRVCVCGGEEFALRGWRRKQGQHLALGGQDADAAETGFEVVAVHVAAHQVARTPREGSPAVHHALKGLNGGECSVGRPPICGKRTWLFTMSMVPGSNLTSCASSGDRVSASSVCRCLRRGGPGFGEAVRSGPSPRTARAQVPWLCTDTPIKLVHLRGRHAHSGPVVVVQADLLDEEGLHKGAGSWPV